MVLTQEILGAQARLPFGSPAYMAASRLVAAYEAGVELRSGGEEILYLSLVHTLWQLPSDEGLVRFINSNAWEGLEIASLGTASPEAIFVAVVQLGSYRWCGRQGYTRPPLLNEYYIPEAFRGEINHLAGVIWVLISGG